MGKYSMQTSTSPRREMATSTSKATSAAKWGANCWSSLVAQIWVERVSEEKAALPKAVAGQASQAAKAPRAAKSR